MKSIFDYESILPLLKENDNINVDKQIKKKLKFDNYLKGYKIDLLGKAFNAKQVLEVIDVVNYLKRNKYHNISILFNFLCSIIADKLVYVIFEDLCYYFINKINCQLYVKFPNLKATIMTDGIKFSAISQLPNKQCFNKAYLKHIYKRHYRDIISVGSIVNAGLSILTQDVRCFLINNGLGNDYSGQLSEVISEIVGNACEHGKSDCILDIDVTDNYKKENNQEEDAYYGVNVTIVNYSKYLFYDLLMEKMNINSPPQGRYKYVHVARKNHSKFWEADGYNEEDFFIISSFQHKISGSSRKPADVGGTGLTTLIKSLEDYSDSNECYLLSGKRCLRFLSEYLTYDKNNLIGFNKSNDYINNAPEISLLGICKVFFPGSAFNLHFVLKKNI